MRRPNASRVALLLVLPSSVRRVAIAQVELLLIGVLVVGWPVRGSVVLVIVPGVWRMMLGGIVVVVVRRRRHVVWLVLVAGGQGSRLGFDHPKGMFPIGPISNMSLYQIHFEKVMARANQFGAPIPMYVMTSPPTHEETTNFLQEHSFFGMDPEHVRIFCQGVMPAVDEEGKLILASKGEIFVSPNGHGGTLAGLVDSGCLEHAESLGVKHLFYGQVDNPGYVSTLWREDIQFCI